MLGLGSGLDIGIGLGIGMQVPVNPVTGNVKSITQIEITIPSGQTSATQTFASVDSSRSVIFWQGFTTTNTGTSADSIYPRVELTNSVTATAFLVTAPSGFSVTVRGTLVEFTSNAVDSVQSGTIALGTLATSGTATITSVDVSRSVVFFYGATTDFTLNWVQTTDIGIQLTNATTVSAFRNAANSSNGMVGYAVVQFKAAVIKSVQQRSITTSSTNSTETDIISSVVTANTIIVYNEDIDAALTENISQYYAQLSDSITVTLGRSNVTNNARTLYYTVLEFAAGVLSSMQRNSAQVTAGNASADLTVTSVNIAKAVCNRPGFLASGSTYPNVQCTAKLLNATTIRSERGGTGNAVTNSYELFEFV